MSHVSYLTKGAANCTLYFLLDLQFYLISDIFVWRRWHLSSVISSRFFFFFFPDASRVDFSLVVCVCVWVTFQYMHVEPKHAQVPFFRTEKHSYPVSQHVSLHYNQQTSLLSGAGHIGWRVQANTRWEMKVAIKLYLCKSKQYNFTVWLMLVWPPSLPEHLVINFPPPIRPV